MHPMNKKRKYIGQVLLDNWDNVIAMTICVIAGIYGLVGGKPGDAWLLTSITWALGLVAFSSIKDRRARDDLQRHIETLKKKTTASDALLNRSSFRPFQDTSANAQEIRMFGASLVMFLGSQQHHLENLILTQGTNVKVLILDQSAPVIESAALCLNAKHTELTQEIELSEMIVRNIAEASQNSRGTIELRKARAFPNYGLTIIDPDKPQGYMTVEYTGYQEKAFLRPHIELTKVDDPIWFELYRNDFEMLWKIAAPCVASKQLTVSGSIDLN
jgi:hypothetical protein